MRKFACMLLVVAASLGTISTAYAGDSAEHKEPKKYKVAAGDSLSSIAAAHNLPTWRPLWNANTNLANPDQINPDQELVIPEGETTDRPLPPGYGEPTPVAAVSAAPSPAPALRAVPRGGGGPASGDLMRRVCMKESGCNYSINTGNGYYGAYQFDVGTWGGYGGYSRADLAPPAVQDAKFQETYARRGCSPWPNTCS